MPSPFVARRRLVFIALVVLVPGSTVVNASSSDASEASTERSPVTQQSNGVFPSEWRAPGTGWLGANDGQPALPGTPIERFTLGADRFASQFVGRLVNDYRVQFQFPFRYARQNPTKFLLGATGITTLILTDHRTHQMLASRGSLEENGLIEPAARLSKWGNTSSAFPLIIGIGAVGLIVRSPRERETSLMLVEALLTSATWTQLLKKTAGRERPREREEEVPDWEGPDLLNDDPIGGEGLRSFPSGHASGIWAVATILANQYPRYKIVPVLGYGTAIAMSYSRMTVGAHWLSDVVVGGLIGYGCAKQVLAAHDPTRVQAYDSGFRLGIDVTGGYKGISVRYDF